MFTQIIAALVLIIWLIAILACVAYFTKRFIVFLRKPITVVDKELQIKITSVIPTFALDVKNLEPVCDCLKCLGFRPHPKIKPARKLRKKVIRDK